MTDSSFFKELREQSQIKIAIVTKYFSAWSKIMLTRGRQKKIAYVDLFCGPGRYENGEKSTPLLIIERAIQDEALQKSLVTIFNDKNPDHITSLQDEFRRIQDINRLHYQPRIENWEVGDDITRLFQNVRLIPTLAFIDPWGYKGISLQLLNAFVKDWGCECIFFFNYNRINPGLSNRFFKEHMNALFGAAKAEALREQLEGLTPRERELTVVEAIAQALKADNRFVLVFRFRNDQGTRTSHHLIFVTKNIKGYEIMKDIMAKKSSNVEQGVASFEYTPATDQQPLLFALSRPLDDLAGMLLHEFAGQTLPMIEIYRRHHVDKPYISRNYKQTLIALENQGKIMIEPIANKRRKNTLKDDAEVTFPQTNKR